ncbi:Acetylornithine/succinyldiaminopimelate aminotransferase [Streptomyces alboniger]
MRAGTRTPGDDNHLDEGPGTVAAIILETIPGCAGIMILLPGYLAGVREICDKYGIVFILDEVMAGFGRTGEWFAADLFDVVPDLMTFAKGVNSGYVPLGGVAISGAIAQTFANALPGRADVLGHPLACAAAVATLNVMAEEGVVENAARLGKDVVGPRCGSWPSGIRRWARCAASACSGPRSWRATGIPWSCSSRTTRRAR